MLYRYLLPVVYEPTREFCYFCILVAANGPARYRLIDPPDVPRDTIPTVFLSVGKEGAQELREHLPPKILECVLEDITRISENEHALSN